MGYLPIFFSIRVQRYYFLSVRAKLADEYRKSDNCIRLLDYIIA